MTPTPTRPEPSTPTREELLRTCERLIDDFELKEGRVGPVQRDVHLVAKWAKQHLTSEPAASVPVTREQIIDAIKNARTSSPAGSTLFEIYADSILALLAASTGARGAVDDV